MTKKVELLAPAGSLEKLKIAYLYGADAVYCGGKTFSLRARASNFSLEDIREASHFAHNLGKKLYVTMNIVPHDEDLPGLKEYLEFLEEVKIDAIIVSSMYIASMARKYAPNVELHFSTQGSVANSLSIKEYSKQGFTRVVLAREVSLNKIALINENLKQNNLPTELEVFIHGGMCTSYSGRCMLSNYLTSRDANRGGCAHSCRWNYDLYRNNQKVNDKYFNIASKDLNGVSSICSLIDLGVESLKIEGRMKSLYYIACIVKCYRNLIDDYYQNDFNKEKINFHYYEEEILKAENRLTSYGFLKGMVTKEQMLDNDASINPTKDFLGIVLDYDEETMVVTLEQRNFFTKDTEVEFFGPKINNLSFVIKEIYDEKGEILDCARHPLEIIKFIVPFKLSKNDMMRKK